MESRHSSQCPSSELNHGSRKEQEEQAQSTRQAQQADHTIDRAELLDDRHVQQKKRPSMTDAPTVQAATATDNIDESMSSSSSDSSTNSSTCNRATAAAAAAAAAAAIDRRYPSHIKRESSTADDADLEKGYDGDQVRLLVGSFNVGNSPLTQLAPWLPYGGKGFDLIVVGLQESTYKAPRGARDSPLHLSSSLSPTNSASPSRGVSPRWAAMQAGEMDETPPPPGDEGMGLSRVSPLLSPVPPALATPQPRFISRRVSTGGAIGLRGRVNSGAGARTGEARRGSGLDVGEGAADDVSCLTRRLSASTCSVADAPLIDPLPLPRHRKSAMSMVQKDTALSDGLASGDGVSGDVRGGKNRGEDGDGDSKGGDASRAEVERTEREHARVGKAGVGAEQAEGDLGAGSEAAAGANGGTRSASKSKQRTGGTPQTAVAGGALSPMVSGRLTPGTLAAATSRASAPKDKNSIISPFNSTNNTPGTNSSSAMGGRRSFWGMSSPRSPSTPVLQKLSLSGPSSLPRDTSEWELRSGPSERSSKLGSSAPALGRDTSSNGGAAVGLTKDVSRFTRARKAVKKRTKELDAGAAHLRSQLSGHLGPDFEQVISLRRMQMRVKIFLRRSLLDVYDHDEGESAAENTGIGKVVANKGGLVCKLRLKGTTMCFVSCHLQAHEGPNHLARRNASCAEILQGARLGDRRVVDVDSQFHHVFWFGDMNYRISFGLQPEEQHARVAGLISEEAWPKLWEGDELLRELRAGNLLTGFQTEPPAFAPTFKTFRGHEEGYSAKRVPSYTDRILWKSLPGHSLNLQLLEFTSFPEIVTSDHKPIHAAFTVKLTPEINPALPEEKKKHRRRARIPAVLDVPRMTSGPMARLVFEDLQAVDLPGIAGGGVRNPFVRFSSDPKHLVKGHSGKAPKTDVRRKTLNPRWHRKYTCHLSVSNANHLRQSHVSLIVLDRERGSKDEILGVANLSLNEVAWVNNNRPAVPSSPSAAALPPRRKSLPLRRRSLSPAAQRRFRSDIDARILRAAAAREKKSGDGSDADPEPSGDGASNDDGKAVGIGASALPQRQRRDDTRRDRPGLKRHRSDGSLRWRLFRRSASLSTPAHRGGVGTPAHAPAPPVVSTAAAEVAAEAAVGGGAGPAHGLRTSSRESLNSGLDVPTNDSNSNSNSSNGSIIANGSRGAGLGGDQAGGATTDGVHAPSSPGSVRQFREASTASRCSVISAATTTIAEGKEGFHGSFNEGHRQPDRRPRSHNNNNNNNNNHHQQQTHRHRHDVASFFQNALQLHDHHHGKSGPMEWAERRGEGTFDLPLVKNGLLRGRISGRCVLILGSGHHGNPLLRIGSIGGYGMGGLGTGGGGGGGGGSGGHGDGGTSGQGHSHRHGLLAGKGAALKRFIPSAIRRDGFSRGGGDDDTDDGGGGDGDGNGNDDGNGSGAVGANTGISMTAGAAAESTRADPVASDANAAGADADAASADAATAAPAVGRGPDPAKTDGLGGREIVERSAAGVSGAAVDDSGAGAGSVGNGPSDSPGRGDSDGRHGARHGGRRHLRRGRRHGHGHSHSHSHSVPEGCCVA